MVSHFQLTCKTKDDFIKRMNEYVFNKTKIHAKFVLKEFPSETILTELIEKRKKLVKVEDDYKKILFEWESPDNFNATKILNPPCFVVTIQGKRVIYKVNELVTAFQHKCFYNKKGEKCAFIKEWLNSPSIRQKNEFGNYPDDSKCPMG